MRRPSTWALLVLLAVALLWSTIRVHRLLQATRPERASRIFYALDGGRQARFLIGDAAEVHLIVSGDGAAPRPLALTASWLDADGRPLGREVLTLESGRPELRAEDGVAVTRPKVIRLRPSPGATAIVLAAAPPRVLVRVVRPSRRHGSVAQTLRAAGVEPAWLAPRDLARLRPTAWQAEPAIDGVAVAIPAAPTDEAAEPEPPAPTGIVVTAQRAAVWNLVGPGAHTLNATARIVVETRSAGGSERREVGAGEPLRLSIGERPTTVVVRAVAEPATVTARLDGVRALGPAPASRRAVAWSADGALRFPLPRDGATPLRLSVRRRDGHARTTAWRLVDGSGRALAAGTLPAVGAIDPFAAVIEGARRDEVSLAAVQTIVPPAAATALVLTAPDALVEVQARAEAGSDPRPAPPFDTPLAAPLRWAYAPSRAPAWVALRPGGAARAVPLDESPHLEPRHSPPSAPSVMLAPVGGAARAQVLEPGRHGQALTALGAAPALVRVAAAGASARRLTATCQVRGDLGGELRLLVDGAAAAHVPVDTGTVRLTGAAAPGVRRVQVVGHAGARCTVDAPRADGRAEVQRTLFAVSPTHPLVWKVRKPSGPFIAHVAVYAERPLSQATLRVDGGVLHRRIGAVAQLTSAARAVPLLGREAALLLPARRPLDRVGVARVVLGDDLPAGVHTIEVATPEAAWLRAWAPGTHRRGERIESYTTSDDEP